MTNYSVDRSIALFALLLAVTVVPYTHAASADAETEARRTLDSFMAAWNQGDNVALRKAMNFPNVTLAGSHMIIANEPEDFSTDFKRMREREGWTKSSFDRITVTKSAPEKVHCNVVYTRYDVDGSAYHTASVFYVITKKDGHWGMQFRGPGTVPSQSLSADERQTVESARQAIQRFFTAFNGADNAALLDTLNLPHAFLLNNGRLVAALDPAGPLVAMDFDGMREREDWHMSSIDSLTHVQFSGSSVSFELVFSRYHQNGMKYRTVPALWVLTNKEGHWGVQFRSLMPATFSE